MPLGSSVGWSRALKRSTLVASSIKLLSLFYNLYTLKNRSPLIVMVITFPSYYSELIQIIPQITHLTLHALVHVTKAWFTANYYIEK